MEVFREARNLVLKGMFKVFGVEYIPKSEITSIEGGQQVLPNEEAIYLQKEVDIPGPSREVVVFDSKGRWQSFREIVGQDQAGQGVVIHKK